MTNYYTVIFQIAKWEYEFEKIIKRKIGLEESVISDRSNVQPFESKIKALENTIANAGLGGFLSFTTGILYIIILAFLIFKLLQ